MGGGDGLEFNPLLWVHNPTGSGVSMYNYLVKLGCTTKLFTFLTVFKGINFWLNCIFIPELKLNYSSKIVSENTKE